jgi:hypothetical protein
VIEGAEEIDATLPLRDEVPDVDSSERAWICVQTHCAVRVQTMTTIQKKKKNPKSNSDLHSP